MVEGTILYRNFLCSNRLIELLGALDGTYIKVHVPEVDIEQENVKLRLIS